LTLGKTNIGGIAQPVPLTAIHIVTEMPRSADVIAPICFSPFIATILDGIWVRIVVTPVSSIGIILGL